VSEELSLSLSLFRGSVDLCVLFLPRGGPKNKRRLRKSSSESSPEKRKERDPKKYSGREKKGLDSSSEGPPRGRNNTHKSTDRTIRI
jgi:hypothetical protein